MKVGTKINSKYKVIKAIGEGGMGRVVQVETKSEEFALKYCIETDPESIKRFKREVRLMESIEHGNVLEILDSDLDHDPPYFVMPLCKFSLDTQIETLSKEPARAIRLLLKVCKGINAIHLSGVVHRDIKPKNILISEDNKIKVSDLGLGKFSERDSTILTQSDIYMGTQGYIPPEFFKVGGTKNADARSDIYQMGKTIYNVFTNQNPVLIEKDRLPGGLLFIIQKCIADDPDDRYQTISELQSALNNYLLALEPESNPLNAFDNLINEAKQNISFNQFDRKNAEAIIHLLFALKDDPEVFFEKSKKIPSRLLEAIASNYKSLIKDYLNVYIPTINKYFKECKIDFADAEPVALQMKSVFNGTKEIDVKVKALQLTLFVASHCNRYKAMDYFDAMIQSIKTEQEAVAVAEMLKSHADYYMDLYDRVPATRLHVIIQKVQNDIRKKAEKRSSSRDDW